MCRQVVSSGTFSIFAWLFLLPHVPFPRLREDLGFLPLTIQELLVFCISGTDFSLRDREGSRQLLLRSPFGFFLGEDQLGSGRRP